MSRLQPERRQVLRAGALVWSVPVIAVAVTAPAFASSGSDLSSSNLGAPVPTGNGTNRSTSLPLSIVNSGTTPTTSLTVRVKVSGGTPNNITAPSGWTVLLDASTNTLVFTSTTQLAGGASTSATFVVRPGNSGSSAVVSVEPGGGGLGRTFVSVPV